MPSPEKPSGTGRCFRSKPYSFWMRLAPSGPLHWKDLANGQDGGWGLQKEKSSGGKAHWVALCNIDDRCHSLPLPCLAAMDSRTSLIAVVT